MALFKVYRGNETNLPSSMNDGWAYFCTDTGNFYIDWTSESGLIRTQVNADCANNLRYLDGNEYAEIDATTLVQGFTTMWTDISNLKTNKADTTALSAGIAEAKAHADEVVANVANDLSAHTGNTTVHITADERTSWNDAFNHLSDSTSHLTATERTNWNAAKTHADSAHAPSNAQANQNAFSNVKVGKTTIVADTTTDTLTIAAGSNITITPDATNDKITIAATDTIYTHPNSGVSAGTYKSITVNAQGHVTGGTNPTTLAGYGITDAESKGAANTALTNANSYTDSQISDEVDARDAAIATAKEAAISTAASDATTKANNALASAKTYADSVASSAANTVKNDLLNGAGAAYDTLKELSDLIVDNQDAIDALESVAAGKADAEHDHAIADVTGLQSALDGKAASSHGTHVTYSTTAPVMDGTATAGSASTVARSDHKHPVDTSRASKTEFDSHSSNTTVHITSTERTNWNAAKTHADSAHAPSDAEKNQNAFSNITVGSTTVSADNATDTLTLVAGTNVTITPDATNDKITISATDTNTTYSAGTGISLSGTTFSNSGVRSISTGSSNGTISVNTNGTSANVAVKGLGSAAYTASTAYDVAGTAQTKADAALTSSKTYTDTVAEGKADKTQAIFYIEGGGTTDTTNKVATWTGSHDDITEYYNGLTIAYKIGTAGSTTTTLNINGLGAVAVVRNVTSAISTAYAINSIVFLTYTTDDSTAYWKTADYDANTRNTVGDYRKNGTKLYFVGTTSSDDSASSSYATSYTNSNIYVKTSNVLYSAQGFQGDLTGNADTATSATSATKATQDASGNVITSTYETKTDADSKLAEAKAYTDEVASTKAASSHNHAASNITSGILSSDRLPTVPITKGGTGATTAAAALTNLGITATAAELNKLDGVTATTTELNYVDGVTSGIQAQLDSKAASSHTHTYAGSSSAGGAATSANKVNSALTVKLNGGTTEGTNMFTFNGSAAKSVNITPSGIGAAASSHTHDDRYYTESEIDSKVSDLNTAINGKAASSHTHSISNVTSLQSTLDDKVSKSNTGVQSIGGGLIVGGESATATGKGRIMVTGNTNPLVGLQAIDANGNQLTPYYFQVTNDVMYLGPTSTKALSFDSDGNTAIPASLAVSGSISEGGTALSDKYAAKSHTHGISDVTNLQSSLDAKQATVTGAATTITGSNLTASRALVSDSSGKVAVSAVTSTELGYLDGVTSSVQAQLDAKAPASHASSATTYGIGTGSNYGHVKLSDSTSSTSAASAGIAASPVAVKSAYDLANTAKTNAATAQSTADTAKANAATAQTRADNAYTLAESKVDSLSDLGITATATELNYVDGVTSGIQAQLDAKQATITGGATTITSSNLTASRALVSDSSGKVAVSAVTSTELGYLDGVTSNVQTQLDGKAASSHGNHVPATGTADNATFLRNDNTWQKVTPANIGAATAAQVSQLSSEIADKVVYVTIDTDALTSSHTLAEIVAAVEAGNTVIATTDGYSYMQLDSCVPEFMASFQIVYASYGDVSSTTVYVNADGTVDVNNSAVMNSGVFSSRVKASDQTHNVSCLRNTMIYSSETNPTVNGEICWTYS